MGLSPSAYWSLCLQLELAHAAFDVVGVTTELEQEDAARVALN